MATAAYMVVLVLATHYPRPEQFLPVAGTSDKMLHCLAYGLLALLAGGTLATAGGWTLRRLTALAAGLVAFAALDEVTQPLFPPRAADLLDWACDCAGLAVGLMGIAIVVRLVGLLWQPGGQRQFGVGAR